MYGSEVCTFSVWWIVPVVMMVFCFLMMRWRGGAMMCGFGSRGSDGPPARVPDSAMSILPRFQWPGSIALHLDSVTPMLHQSPEADSWMCL